MNRPGRIRYLLLRLLLISALLGACAPPPSAPPENATEPPSTGQATEPPATEPATELPTTEPGQAPVNIPTVPEPDNIELRSAVLDGTISSGTIAGITVFFGVGRLTNAADQVLLINVVGPTDTSVIDYFNSAKFYFEIRGPIDLEVAYEGEKKLPDLSNADLFKDAQMEYLIIDFDLSPETYEKYTKGTLLVVVDPTVRQNQYNNYGMRNPPTDRVDVTMKVSQNQVEGTLYRECAAIIGQTKRSTPALSKTLTGIGAGDFDLTIKGINSGDNKYKVTGAWNYDYSNFVPSELVKRITC